MIDRELVSELLAPGQTLDFLSVFGTNPTSFLLDGIDPTLMLDPTNPLAFPTGVAFVNPVTAGDSAIMTPITVDAPGSSIPLPATPFLVLLGLTTLGFIRRHGVRTTSFFK